MSIADSVLPEPIRVGRARPLPRTARVSMLGAAIERAGSSQRAVARAWGVDERIVRDVCAGIRPFPEDKLDACPAGVQRAWLELRLTALDDGPPPSRMAPERHLMLAGERHGQLCAETREALADLVFTTPEKVAVRRRALALIDVVRSYVRELDADILAGGGK